MAVAKIEIANRALGHIGVTTQLASLTEATPAANAINLHYDGVLDEVLRKAHWGFARAEVTAAALETTIGQWSYAYGYPADAIKVRELIRANEPITETSADRIIYDLAYDPASGMQAIVSNEAAAIIVYTKRIEDPGVYDPLFVSALEYRLAAAIAPGLARDRETMADMMQVYMAKLGEARVTTLNERRRLKQPTSRQIAARTRSIGT